MCTQNSNHIRIASDRSTPTTRVARVIGISQWWCSLCRLFSGWPLDITKSLESFQREFGNPIDDPSCGYLIFNYYYFWLPLSGIRGLFFDWILYTHYFHEEKYVFMHEKMFNIKKFEWIIFVDKLGTFDVLYFNRFSYKKLFEAIVKNKNNMNNFVA